MDGYTGTISPPGMYVRALYDYTADDRTSLSFKQGDIIRVLTTLESGWWDGVIHNERGWFPSNYCALVETAEARRLDQGLGPHGEDLDIEGSSDGDYENEFEFGMQDGSGNANQTEVQKDQEEAAFWIPQATPDGKLFYFNTLTGVSTMELPLESPVTVNESGPRERANFTSESARPPPERMAGGYEKDEDTDFDQSASEAEDMTRSRGASATRARRSYMSNDVSPPTSMDSFAANQSPVRTRENVGTSSFTVVQNAIPPNGTSKTSFMAGPARHSDAYPPQKAFYDEQPVPLTWTRLVDDMRKAVERYRQAINNSDRSEFVKRAEDISDHLRLLLAAGSGTTDNHSGNPSIISTNKALYPHFRDMMSRFSKLVLSSHIASADWPPADSFSKCLQEADGVLSGVYGFVEVARQQRGEEIPRLFPGFVDGHLIGGNWQNNGLTSHKSDGTAGTSLVEPSDHGHSFEPNVQLDEALLGRMTEMKRRIDISIRRLDEKLVVQDKIISKVKHKRKGDEICAACGRVIELYKDWMSSLESINLSSIKESIDTSQMSDFSVHKQKVYVFVAELVISCQAVAAPLADEWSEFRGQSFEERITRVRAIWRELEASTGRVMQTLHAFQELVLVSSGDLQQSPTDHQHQKSLSSSSKGTGRSVLGEASSAVSVAENNSISSGVAMNASNAKVKKFFGEVPVSEERRGSEETPFFLRLDYEGDIQYDFKTDPPSIRGGTLTGLVEQLTRHDKLDAPFNNTFLLTFQSFTTATELFEMLVRRWSIQPAPGLSGEQYNVWVEKKQNLIRFRIVNVLKSWFDYYWMEGNDDASLDVIRRAHNFAKDTVAQSNIPGIKALLMVIEQRSRGEDVGSKRMVPNSNVEPPPPILPKSLKKFKFQDIDATEFARQLTVIESRLYRKIKPYECLNKIWQKKSSQDAEPAVNVKALILHSNRLTNWVAEMILMPTDVKKRVSIIKHFVTIADKCLSMYNFSTLTSIISALGTAPIHRLNRTWGALDKKTTAVLEKMRKLMGSTKNFAEYREALHQANPPCIPFFGVYLTDLTFIEDGIPSVIQKTDLINFAKRAKTAEVIREIQTYQNVSYPFKAVPELQDWIVSCMQNAGDVHEMYDRSLQVEPREREDEKIQRLLTESGFM